MRANSSNKHKEPKTLLVPITFFSTTWTVWVNGASENKHTKGNMKKTVLLIAILAALQTLTITILAQPGPGRGPREGGGGPGGHRPPPPPLVDTLDANHDGVIDAQEIANAPAALASLDANGDGTLTRDELRPKPPGQQGGNGPRARAGRSGGEQENGGPGDGPNGHRPPPALIAVLDSNQDGAIDAQEIANASASLLTLDKNADGQLSVEEICPPPPGGGGPEQ